MAKVVGIYYGKCPVCGGSLGMYPSGKGVIVACSKCKYIAGCDLVPKWKY